MAANLFLNVGSDGKAVPGFVSVDLRSAPSAKPPKKFTYGDKTVDAIFSEDFLDHLTQAQGLAFLRECRRVLKPGGLLRIALSDLDDLVDRYGKGDWRRDGDVRAGWVDNRCEMMNIGMREWGHQWVYNEEELRLAANRAGLEIVGRVPWGESSVERFRGLEYRQSSHLVMEFRKPARAQGSTALVSLLIPAYKPQFFEEALKSALAQTYSNLEILIFDDCPGPEIESIVRRLADSDRRVTYERNAERQGGLGNYLRCFERANGAYIKFLNDDDVIAPTCVERMVRVLASEPDVTLVTSHRRCIDERGRFLPDIQFTRKVTDVDCVFEGASYAVCMMKYGNCVGEPTTTMFRKEDAAWIRPHIMSFGGELLRGIGDASIWMNLLGRGDAAYLAETLSHFRQHDGQRQKEPEIAAVIDRSFAQMRMHARRLGFHEHARAPMIKVRSLASDAWEMQRFRWAPRVDLGKLDVKSLKRRAARIVKKRIREPLRRIRQR